MTHRLLERTGIELEYMIVDRETLAVRPLADELLRTACGELVSECDRGGISWSNELAMHVVEFKTTEPPAALGGVSERFAEAVAFADGLLGGMGARLLPTAMHPWMDPAREFARWPHDYGEVYAALDRIFDCSGHGWANLQSVHVNLSFCGDAEFGRLHAALRLLLPIMPALAASSPYADGRWTGFCDYRMEVYRSNARRVPSVSGAVVPEALFTRASYEAMLEGIYADLAPHDPEGLLRHEWINARGAIARFDRMSVEVRVLDVQECPAADLAVVEAVVGAVRRLVERELPVFSEERLAAVLWAAARNAENAVIEDAEYLGVFGVNAPATAGEVWQSLGADLEHGTLATRLRRVLGDAPSRDELAATYRELADCLAEGQRFRV